MAKQPQNINVQTGDTAKYVVYGVVAVGVLGLAYFGIIRPILQTLQIVDTKEEKKGKKDEAKLSRTQVLSPQLYRNNRDKVSISSAKAYSSANNVYEGRGTFWDDEDLAVGAITSSGSKVNISYIADAFNQMYGTSMETYMDYLEPEDWTTIDNYISKIKKFK
jgi:hypothetical protein